MLEHVAIFLAAAVVAVPLFKRLGLGSVLGYLAAGAVIGPSGFGWIREVDHTLHFAELGVVLLLFLIGLELEPARLWRMRGDVFAVGALQVLLSTALIGGVASAFGVTPRVAFVVGVSLAMSSTAFATQILSEKHEISSPHGRAAFGILLFQDLVAVPVLAIVPLLGEGAHSDDAPKSRYLVAFGAIIVVILIGRFLLRPALGIVARARSHELSVAAALLVVLGTAMAMEQVGLSMALGAFLSGVLLADSEYRHELEANIEPFKGLLLGLFFIAVGMSANLRLLAEEPLVVLGIAAGIVFAKSVVLVVLGRLKKLDAAGQAGLAVSISQGGEFAFVIFGVAVGANLMGGRMVDRLIVAVTLSMVMTPLLFIARDRVLASLRDRTRAEPELGPVYDASEVIIAGFGRFGQIIGRVLRARRVPYTALDANPEHIDFLRRFGSKIYYGDASRLDLLRAAKADSARVFVLAIDDFEASMRTLRVVQQHFPHLRVVARARNRQHAYALYGAGVTAVIRETFAGSLDAAKSTLEALGFAPSEARATVRRFGEYDEEQVRANYVHRDDEKALVASAKKYAAELERILESDEEV